MDDFQGCICHLLGSLIGGVWNAMAESDAFSVNTDLGGLSSQGGMQAATVTQPRLPAVGGGAPGDAAATDAGTLADPATIGSGGVTPAQIAAVIIVVAVLLMTFFQGSSHSSPSATKRRRGGGGGGPGGNGHDGDPGDHRREGPSVA